MFPKQQSVCQSAPLEPLDELFQGPNFSDNLAVNASFTLQVCIPNPYDAAARFGAPPFQNASCTCTQCSDAQALKHLMLTHMTFLQSGGVHTVLAHTSVCVRLPRLLPCVDPGLANYLSDLQMQRCMSWDQLQMQTLYVCRLHSPLRGLCLHKNLSQHCHFGQKHDFPKIPHSYVNFGKSVCTLGFS